MRIDRVLRCLAHTLTVLLLSLVPPPPSPGAMFTMFKIFKNTTKMPLPDITAGVKEFIFTKPPLASGNAFAPSFLTTRCLPIGDSIPSAIVQ